MTELAWYGPAETTETRLVAIRSINTLTGWGFPVRAGGPWVTANLAKAAAERETPCADMKASTVVARDQRGYDESGVATARCKHALLLAATSMSGGETFANSLALVATLREVAPELSRLWYDVGDARLEATIRTFPELEGVQPMLPRMHARMHGRACQILYDGITFKGAGLPNSELSEQENRRMGAV